MSSAKQMFYTEGFEGFVSKPIETEELERVLKKVLPKNMFTLADDYAKREERTQSDTTENTVTGFARVKEELKKNGVNTEEALQFLGGEDGIALTSSTFLSHAVCFEIPGESSESGFIS